MTAVVPFRLLPFLRVAGDQIQEHSVFVLVFRVLCRVRERNDIRYKQFQIYPETIEQELRPVICELTDLRRIIV